MNGIRAGSTRVACHFPTFAMAILLAVFGDGLSAQDFLIREGASWKFLRGTEEPTPAGDGSPTDDWAQPGFDDSAWETGPSGIGYDDGDDMTILDDMEDNYYSVYMRKTFVVPDALVVGDLIFEVDYDDGFVAYLNGEDRRARQPCSHL